ncbi:hypothetical protein AK830_g10539 [Neonectria ditissima]|uniref:Uncharacterized protein n=1 Tax=Neonectria ditissima TaxID=78410 RepID=A0A0P7BAD0_9HYPO|nr:hypothetical protein AK830_g10539 [Neonectria ditissima]
MSLALDRSLATAVTVEEESSSIADTAERSRLLLSCCQDAFSGEQKQFVTAQLSRFNLWASNIGVFSSRQACLDYRLRTSPTAKAAVDGNLEILCTQLLSALAGDTDLDDDVLDAFGELELSQIPGFGMNLFQKSSGDARNSALEVVETSIGTLHQLSLAIRGASNRNSLVKVPRLYGVDQSLCLARDPEDLKLNSGEPIPRVRFDATPGFEDFLRRVLKSRWFRPDQNAALTQDHQEYRDLMFERCVFSISIRRRQLAYFQSHQTKLAKQSTVKYPSYAPAETVDFNSQPSQMATRLPSALARLKGPDMAQSPFWEPIDTIPSETVGSEFQSTSFKLSSSAFAPSSAASSSDAGGLTAAGPFEIPPAPSLGVAEKEKMCPYCCLVYPSKTFSTQKKSRRWKKHILEDLHPYVCLFKNCTQPGKAYRSFKDWQTHLSQTHDQAWQCSLPHPKSEKNEEQTTLFNTADQFQAHLSLHHPTFNPPSTDSILQSSRRPAVLPQWCFVCLAEQSTSITLQRHLAAHLEQAFLLALPGRDDIKNSDTATSGNLSSFTAADSDSSQEAGLSDISSLYGHVDDPRSAGTKTMPVRDFAVALSAINTESALLKAGLFDTWATRLSQTKVFEQSDYLRLSTSWRKLILTVQFLIRLRSTSRRAASPSASHLPALGDVGEDAHLISPAPLGPMLEETDSVWSGFSDLSDSEGSERVDESKGEPWPLDRAEFDLMRIISDVQQSTHRDASLERVEGGHRLRTTLLEHQERALAFMLQRESGEIPEEFRLWEPRIFRGTEIFFHRITDSRSVVRPHERGGGVLADEMGMGKTLSTLALIINTIEEGSFWAVESNAKSATHPGIRNRARTTLIIVPSKLIIDSWLEQISKHIGDAIKVIKYHGASRERRANILSQADIVLTTYQTLATDFQNPPQAILYSIGWFRIVLDEAHYIHQPATNFHHACVNLTARSRWCLTGTPIQTKLEDLGALFIFLRVEEVCDMTRFRRYLIFPLLQQQNAIAKERLVMLYDAFILARTRDILDMPRQEERIRKLELSPSERSQYNMTAEILDRFIRQQTDDTRNKFFPIQDHLQLRILCNYGTHQKFSTWKENLFGLNKETMCGGCLQTRPISSENAQSEFVENCTHIFCQECLDCLDGSLISPESRRHCPICSMPRESLRETGPRLNIGGANEKHDVVVQQADGGREGDAYFNREGYSTKMTVLVRDVKETLGDSRMEENGNPTKVKSVILSCWDLTLDLIGIYLAKENIEFLRIDGQCPLTGRQRILDLFSQPSGTQIMLTTTSIGAVGLNLSAASRIFVVEPQWNPIFESRTIARIIRLGHRDKVIVTRIPEFEELAHPRPPSLPIQLREAVAPDTGQPRAEPSMDQRNQQFAVVDRSSIASLDKGARQNEEPSQVG